MKKKERSCTYENKKNVFPRSYKSFDRLIFIFNAPANFVSFAIFLDFLTLQILIRSILIDATFFCSIFLLLKKPNQAQQTLAAKKVKINYIAILVASLLAIIQF